MLKFLFWVFVAVDVVALATFGLLGLAAAGPSGTNPIAALIIPFLIPAAVLVGAIWLFASTPTTGARALAIFLSALPVLFVIGGKAMTLWELRGFRDAAGNIQEFRSPALREIEAAIARNDAAAIAVAAHGVDLDTPGLSDATVLVLALRQLRHTPGQFEVLRALLAAGADPNVSGGELPLQAAIGESRTSGVEPVRLLLDAGADPNARTEWGQPVFFIAGGSDIEVMQLLLDRGADVRLRDPKGVSAVVLPAQTRNWRVLELLVRRGAPWRDQNAIQGVPFFDYMEREEREATSGAGNTHGLADVMALLRSETP